MFSFISGETFFPVSCSSHSFFSHGIALHASSFWWLPFSIGYCKNIHNQSKVVSQEHGPYTWVSIFQMKRLCQQLFVPEGKNLKLFIKRHVTIAPFCCLTVSTQRQLWAPWERAIQQRQNSLLQCLWKFWREECITCLSHCFPKDFWSKRKSEFS